MKHTVEHIRLSSGAEGLFIDVPDSSVTWFDISFRAGDYLSPVGKMDTAHVMEHLVLGANSKFKKSADYSQEFTKNGAYNNAYTGDYHMGYVAECAEFETERILDLLCLAIEAPLFLNSEFNAEIANVREELKMRRNNHDSELALTLEHKMGFVPNSYGNRAKQLSAIELKDIKNHYQKTHFAKNTRFVIAGQIKKRQDLITARLEKLALPKGGERIDLPNESPIKLTKPLVIKNDGIDNVYYRWESAFGEILATEKKDCLMAVQDILFATFHSRVFGKAREKGLAYGIGSNYYRTKNDHVWFVNGQVQANNLKPLIKLLTNQVKNIANGQITKSEIEAIKAYQYGSFQRGIQTINQLANWYQPAFVTADIVKDYESVKQRIFRLNKRGITNITNSLLDNPVWGIAIMHSSNDVIDVAELHNDINAIYNY